MHTMFTHQFNGLVNFDNRPTKHQIRNLYWQFMVKWQFEVLSLSLVSNGREKECVCMCVYVYVYADIIFENVVWPESGIFATVWLSTCDCIV